ncbi:ERI1 exoribonuclease 2-like [Sitodiplosis mosellana]|uniref:ERI1 exoribonuclease 2-like n=1 Tax=Sitodiplosis mosellana TaxID=263140 RepID=UPI0024449385|nr:ERI1 exoribonuclease 2-like [Sitodiplosis mosellana]
MSFKYLICLDFEATCWSYDWKENAEIIEFGAILLNVNSGTIEDRFHHYVRPIRYPQLSEYCINLTGITQSMVDCQPTFSTIYSYFIDWLRMLQNTKGLQFTSSARARISDGPNTTFCSWSNWDLSFYFRNDCARNHIICQPLFKAWIDVRQLFNQIYMAFINRNLRFSYALEIASIRTVGSPHSAISDAINLAKLAMHLINRGVRFNAITNYY